MNGQRLRLPVRTRRRGAAAVEFAIVAPIFFLMVMGMLELGRAIMVQQMLTNAAREGARLGILESTTTTAAISDKVKKYLPSLSAAALSKVTVSVNPSPYSAFPPTAGNEVAVVVSVPFSQVSWVPVPKYLGGSASLTATAIMRREGVQ